MGQWLQRLVSAGLQNFADEVVVGGAPWNMAIVVRGRDYVKAPDGRMVYQNRYVLWGHAVWGRITDYEAYEDASKVRALRGSGHRKIAWARARVLGGLTGAERARLPSVPSARWCPGAEPGAARTWRTAR